MLFSSINNVPCTKEKWNHALDSDDSTTGKETLMQSPIFFLCYYVTALVEIENAKREFYLVEYAQLRPEVLFYLNDASSCVVYALLGSAAVWSWLCIRSEWHNHKPIIALPAVLSAFAFLKWISVSVNLQDLSDYLCHLECVLANSGWEHHLRSNGWQMRFFKSGMVHLVIFVVLIIANVYFAVKFDKGKKKLLRAGATSEEAAIEAEINGAPQSEHVASDLVKVLQDQPKIQR